jgi:hypothetical protein
VQGVVCNEEPWDLAAPDQLAAYGCLQFKAASDKSPMLPTAIPANVPVVQPKTASPRQSLELSHAVLRAGLTFAGKRSLKLNFGRRNDPLLVILRRVLREARAAAKCDASQPEGASRPH